MQSADFKEGSSGPHPEKMQRVRECSEVLA